MHLCCSPCKSHAILAIPATVLPTALPTRFTALFHADPNSLSLSSNCLLTGFAAFCHADSGISATVLVLSSVQDSRHLSRWLMILYLCLHYSVSVFHRIRHAGPLISAAVLVMSHRRDSQHLSCWPATICCSLRPARTRPL
jgi:hypothetical protein